MHSLLEKVTLGPGEKMVFGKVVKTKGGGKKDAKAKYKSKDRAKRMRMRKRADPNKVVGKGFGKETQRQIDHGLDRGVKKVRGAKESIDVRLADIADQLRDLLA
jgi:hypothetical protein